MFVHYVCTLKHLITIVAAFIHSINPCVVSLIIWALICDANRKHERSTLTIINMLTVYISCTQTYRRVSSQWVTKKEGHVLPSAISPDDNIIQRIQMCYVILFTKLIKKSELSNFQQVHLKHMPDSWKWRDWTMLWIYTHSRLKLPVGKIQCSGKWSTTIILSSAF